MGKDLGVVFEDFSHVGGVLSGESDEVSDVFDGVREILHACIQLPNTVINIRRLLTFKGI